MNDQTTSRPHRARPAAGLLLVLLSAATLADTGHATPGITPIPLDTPATTAFQYPPDMRVGDSTGIYHEAVAFPSQSFAQGRVAFWAAPAGTLKSNGYPIDEFVYVIEGELETTDRDGTVRRFGPGATFVIPKGWVGEWRMKTDFRKLFVNF